MYTLDELVAIKNIFYSKGKRCEVKIFSLFKNSTLRSIQQVEKEEEEEVKSLFSNLY
jgi:hypothetical protein